MTTGLLLRRLLTAIVVAVIGLGLSALPADAVVAGSGHSKDLRTPGLDKCGPGPTPAAKAVYRHALRDWRQCVRAAQKAQKANDRCVVAKKHAYRAAKRSAALAGKHNAQSVEAAKRAEVTERRAKQLCALVVSGGPRPVKPPATPGQGFAPPPAPAPVVPTPPVTPTQPVVAPITPPVAVPAVPAPTTSGSNPPATTSGARTSGAASAARAPLPLGELRATGRDSRLPYSISSRDSRIPALVPAVAPKATFPLLLMILLLVGFLFVQRWIDRGDPKLAGASAPDGDLQFE